VENNIINIYVDESGTLPDPNDKFVVMAAVVIPSAKEGHDIIQRTLSGLRQLRVRIPELKFYHASHSTKRKFLSAMVAAGFEIFILVVDKKGRKIADSPEHFARLTVSLISEICFSRPATAVNLIMDRHFTGAARTELFNSSFQETAQALKLHVDIRHVDSQEEPLVNIADMAAGSVFWKYTGKSREFYGIIHDNIVVEKIVSWPELQNRTFGQNKKFT
jgi:hypothetical protein